MVEALAADRVGHLAINEEEMVVECFNHIVLLSSVTTPHCHPSPPLTVIRHHPSLSSITTPHCHPSPPLTVFHHHCFTVIHHHPSLSSTTTPHCHPPPPLTVIHHHPSLSSITTPHCHPSQLTQLLTATSGLAEDHDNRSCPSESLRLLLRVGVRPWLERLLE